MEKKELVFILDKMLTPIGFKRKGNYWVINNNVIAKMVNLQKSKFGNSFYINYGYIIKALPLNGLMMHIFDAFGSFDEVEQQRIISLLDFESNISNEYRINELEKLLHEKVLLNIHKVNTEEDILSELKKRPHLNDVPLVVKKYFNIEE